MNIPGNNLEDDNVKFIEIAAAYCKHIENFQRTDKFAFAQRTRILLSLLFSSGLNLQPITLSEFYSDIDEIDQEMYSRALENIKNNVPFQYYITALNPLDLESDEMGTGDLIEDLHDIYKDLKLGLLSVEQAGGSQEFALWQFQVMFSHWSDHCVNAIQILHEYISDSP